MEMAGNIIFIVLLIAGAYFFARKVGRIRRNILLGRPEDLSAGKAERLRIMTRVALGQSKMGKRPVAALLHLFVYAGFIIINIEVLEIIIDGIFGTHRVFAFLGGGYNFLIAAFEVLALLVILACVIFLIRRNIIYVRRLQARELTRWPRTDANIILLVEILLMSAFLTMNATDSLLQTRGVDPYVTAGSFPVSSIVAPLFAGLADSTLIGIERFTWWFHILGIMAFLNYIPYSKHFHIFLAFPNTYYTWLKPKGKLENMPSVTREVQLMMDPSAAPPAETTEAQPQSFGVKDVQDLSWKSLMDAYTCTECGRCTAECPANLTGKLLSPRKIMMDTRDRLEEVGENINKQGKDFQDDKTLHSYITPEELWACTSCQACVEACPVNINPLQIILEMRRYLVMEQSAAPSELNSMFTSIENNGAPWQFSPADRFNWAKES